MVGLVKVGDRLKILGGTPIRANRVMTHPYSEWWLVQLGGVVTLL